MPSVRAPRRRGSRREVQLLKGAFAAGGLGRAPRTTPGPLFISGGATTTPAPTKTPSFGTGAAWPWGGGTRRHVYARLPPRRLPAPGRPWRGGCGELWRAWGERHLAGRAAHAVGRALPGTGVWQLAWQACQLAFAHAGPNRTWSQSRPSTHCSWTPERSNGRSPMRIYRGLVRGRGGARPPLGELLPLARILPAGGASSGRGQPPFLPAGATIRAAHPPAGPTGT